MAEKLFLGKFHQDRSSSLCFRDKHIFVFYAEIQDGCQKWWENNLVDSADTMWVKNFVKITLCSTVSEINACLSFTQKFKMAANMAGNNFWEKSPEK